MRLWRFAGLTLAGLSLATALGLKPPPILSELAQESARPRIEDRRGQRLRFSVADSWNTSDRLHLDEAPPLLLGAIIEQEDRRFYTHAGVDWRARLSALAQNWRARRVVRGASTLSEQVVRMIHPRPRHLWSKWLEGLEAMWLERRNTKSEILEFYLNQVPYASGRRGVVQAADFFFGRSLKTLNTAETLTLAVMIKSPSRLARFVDGRELSALAARLEQVGRLERFELTPVVFTPAQLEVRAPSFVSYVQGLASGQSVLHTTLDPGLQTSAQRLLDEALRSNSQYDLNNAALIVLDHRSDEVLAWAVGQAPGGQAAAYNAPLVPRQPGSALKPFLYTLAFEQGFLPASLVEDAPLKQTVGSGQHAFRNYSRTHYGWISLREALANSLNIPAVRLLGEVGLEVFYGRLKELGLHSLRRPAAYYGEGLALGNGEVSLLEMVRAYATLARGGLDREPRFLRSNSPLGFGRRVLSPEAASLTAHVLSDAVARRLEFGRGGTMNFPFPTAVKTGTSNDFRDAWAFAFNARFVIGIWMGNLDERPTRGLTGSTAPMMIARALMNQAMVGQPVEPLALSPRLVRRQVCRQGLEITSFDGRCSPTTELFLPEGSPSPRRVRTEADVESFEIAQPSPGLHLALDPRLSAEDQQLVFRVRGADPAAAVRWEVDGELLGESPDPRQSWRLSKGRHVVTATQGGRESTRVFYVR